MHSVKQLNVPTAYKPSAKWDSTGTLHCGLIHLCVLTAPPARTTLLVKVDLLGLCLPRLSQARQGQQ